jgi:hypothetical protein
MLRKIALALIALLVLGVAVILALALAEPDEIYVERSASIAAAPDVVYGYVNDLHRFTEWSPWQKRDLQMNTSFQGPASGVGASYSWRGNRNVGAGRLTITESIPVSEVKMRLEFSEPFVATNHVQFTFAPTAEGTRVNWAMTGSNDFSSKVLSVFVDTESMVGHDFETGLASLAELAEKR